MPIGVKYHHCFLLKGLLKGITTGEVPGRSSLSDLMKCACYRLCAEALPFMRRSVTVYAQGGIPLFNCFFDCYRLCAEALPFMRKKKAVFI